MDIRVKVMKTAEEIFDEKVGRHHRELSPMNYANTVEAMKAYAKEVQCAKTIDINNSIYKKILKRGDPDQLKKLVFELQEEIRRLKARLKELGDNCPF